MEVEDDFRSLVSIRGPFSTSMIMGGRGKMNTPLGVLIGATEAMSDFQASQ